MKHDVDNSAKDFPDMYFVQKYKLAKGCNSLKWVY